MRGFAVAASIDGVEVGRGSDAAWPRGMAGLGSGFHEAYFRSFGVGPPATSDADEVHAAFYQNQMAVAARRLSGLFFHAGCVKRVQKKAAATVALCVARGLQAATRRLVALDQVETAALGAVKAASLVQRLARKARAGATRLRLEHERLPTTSSMHHVF